MRGIIGIATRSRRNEIANSLPVGLSSGTRFVISWHSLYLSIDQTAAVRLLAGLVRIIMIRNGLYSVVSKVLDGVEGGATGVSVLRDGKMCGGGPVYYHVGSYVCSDGKWKGDQTIGAHTPSDISEMWFSRHVVSMGFTGTYTDDGAEYDATCLVGKRSIRLNVIFRLLVPI
jgi:hypothetical protein